MLFFECFFNYLYLTADSLINDLNKCLAHAHLIFVKKKKSHVFNSKNLYFNSTMEKSEV